MPRRSRMRDVDSSSLEISRVQVEWFSRFAVSSSAVSSWISKNQVGLGLAWWSWGMSLMSALRDDVDALDWEG